MQFITEQCAQQSGYRLLRLRGEGAFGRVWEAQAPDGQRVAFKCVRSRTGVVVQELRNTQRVSQLSHPHLVDIQKIWCEGEKLIYVMELADGSLHDLADVSRSEFGMSLSAEMVCGYLRQAAQALDFLNSRKHALGGLQVGIQHGDIKPSNLLLFGEVVKLADFGLSCVTAAPVVRHQSTGTPSYAAPEVFHGSISDWTDQYALAVTYCMLRGGRLPFASPTPTDFAKGHARPILDLSMLNRGEQPIITRALASVPQDRWPSCGEMMRQLAEANGRMENRPTSERRTAKRRTCPHKPEIRLVRREGGGEIQIARLANLSHHGMGVVMTQAVDVGTAFLFVPKIPGQKENRLFSVRIVRIDRLAEGAWFAGCRLSLPLRELEMQGLLQPPEGTSSGTGKE